MICQAKPDDLMINNVKKRVTNDTHFSCKKHKNVVYFLQGGENMDIILRDIKPSVVAEIDELAKKKKLSRNAFLKMYLENMVISKEINNIESSYKDLVKTVMNVVEEHSHQIEKLTEQIERLNNGKNSYNI